QEGSIATGRAAEAAGEAPRTAQQGVRRTCRNLAAAPGTVGQEVRRPGPGNAADRAVDPGGELRIPITRGPRPTQILCSHRQGHPESGPELRSGHHPRLDAL